MLIFKICYQILYKSSHTYTQSSKTEKNFPTLLFIGTSENMILVDVVASSVETSSTNFSISKMDLVLNFTSMQECPAIL